MASTGEEDYIGVGVAAAGFEANRRYQNTPSIETYLELINSGVPAAVESTMNTEADNMEEFMFMGLRMINGISMSEFKRRFNQGDCCCLREGHGAISENRSYDHEGRPALPVGGGSGYFELHFK